MHLFSADTPLLKRNQSFFLHENLKKLPSKVAHNQPNFFFQYCQPAQNQLKSHILFHKDDSLLDVYIMTLLLVAAANFSLIYKMHDFQDGNPCTLWISFFFFFCLISFYIKWVFEDFRTLFVLFFYFAVR